MTEIKLMYCTALMKIRPKNHCKHFIMYRLICPDSSIHKFCGTNLGVIVQKWLSAP